MKEENFVILVIIFVLIQIFGLLAFEGSIDRIPAQNVFGTIRIFSPDIKLPILLPPCLHPESKPYIIINPISTHWTDDLFDINGTTNLGMDKKIKISLGEARHTATGPYDTCEIDSGYTDSSGFVTMERGYCGITKWSYRVNLSGFHSASYGVGVVWEENRNVTNFTGLLVRGSNYYRPPNC